MKILAVDTALGACSAALLDGETTVAHRFIPMERGHAEAIAPMVEAVMREGQTEFSELERLAVTTGPGTFTGQRVGLAFMRALKVALRIPLIGVTTLDAMAAAALEETGASHAASLHDAKRGEVYAGLATRERTLIEPSLLALENAVAAIDMVMQESVAGKLAFAGTAGCVACGHYQPATAQAVLSSIVWPEAQWVARLAVRAPAPSHPPRPLYLRPPDARLPAIMP